MTETGAVKNRIDFAGILMQREVIAICLYVFLADMVLGMTRPILSLFSQSLGASLSLIGALSLVVGLTQLGSAVAIGTFSDRHGRKGVLITGMLLLGLTAVLIGVTSQPGLLLPTQILLGLGFVCTITISTAYVADVVTDRDRSLAIGLTTTMMGLGYATGAWLGGTAADTWGYTTAYLLAAGLAVFGSGVAWIGIPSRKDGLRPTVGTHKSHVYQQAASFIKDPMIMAISFGAVLIFLVFGGLVIAFFPVYAYGLGISPAIIGIMLAARALASTLARLPGGALAVKIPGYWLLMVAMVLAMIFAFCLPQTQRPLLLMALLLGEGIGYGLYLTLGQTMIATFAGVGSRGAALGMYSMMTGIGGSLLPFFLGITADHFGLASIYYLTGFLLVAGIAFLLIISRRVGQTTAPEATNVSA